MNYLNVTINKLNQKQNIFLTGGAGVGKTTLTNEIIKIFQDEAKKVAKLASTGMASTLIEGQTLHSFFDFGIASSIEELDKNAKLNPKKKIKKLIQSIDLIVIDEISMVSDMLFDMVMLRIEQSDFNGVLLVVGDFLQLPPVSRSNKNVMFAFESQGWQDAKLETVELTHIYRTDDKEFIELLHNVRFGFINEHIHNQLNNYIKPIPNDLSKFTFLFGKNISADIHNIEQLKHIDTELFIKEAQIIKHIKDINESDITRFIKDARVDKTLELKIDAPILFTRNSWNYFNGERGVIINYDEQYIYIKKDDNKIVKLETIAHHKTLWKEKKIDNKVELIEEKIFTIYQYPIKLAFAITIHKSQGMSIENLIIQTNEIFAPSQFYVALSRSSKPNSLVLIAPKKQWYQLAYVDAKALQFYANN